MKIFNSLEFFDRKYILNEVFKKYQINGNVDKYLIDSTLLLNLKTEIQEFIENTSDQYKNQYKPLSKIFNIKEFYGYEFYVNENVLCPRPETEILIDTLRQNINYIDNLRILDLGTGSGCLAIVLKKIYPNAEVFAIDLCDKALSTAKKNATNLNVDINFIKNDWLDNIEENFDILVSNPPYLTACEIKKVPELKYDPFLALYEGNIELEKYIKIYEKKHLFSKVFLEINHNKLENIYKLFYNIKLNVKKDLNNDVRVIYF